MNAVRDFLDDPVRMDETLAIPPKIRTRSEYLVDTTGPVWITPPSFCNFDWSSHEDLGGLLRVIQAYAAALLGGMSEDTADNFNSSFKLLSSHCGWDHVATQWVVHGEITLSTMLGLKQVLSKASPDYGWSYFSHIRRWYYWAYGLGIPGFNLETVDKLRSIKGSRKISFTAKQQIAPGAPKSGPSKNRICYTGGDFARIQAALLHLEGRLNKGEIILSTGRDFSSIDAFAQLNILKNNWCINTKHLILGWLACLFGDRPKAFCHLRASDFRFFEVGGVSMGTVRLSNEVKGRFGRLTKRSKRMALPLNEHLIRLVPKFIEENSAWAARNGIDPSWDLPLFPIKRLSGKFADSRSGIVDQGSKRISTSNTLAECLRSLFKVLNVRTANGDVIIPTFSSFRDGNHTGWSRKMPLESVMAITGKKGLRSFKHYTKPGIRHLTRLDEVTEYTGLAQAMNSPILTSSIAPEARIPGPFPYVEDGALRVGVEGGCGCYGSSCPMAFDGSADCYVCPQFTPCVEGPHEWILKVLVDLKADMIARGLPKTEWTRYDRHIASVNRVIVLVQEWRRNHLDKENP